MAYANKFGGAIWTNHAIERMQQRKLTQEMALQSFQHPDRELPGKQSGTMEYQRRFGKSLVTIIAKKNENGEWIILSCWIDPPLYGTQDYSKKEKYNTYMDKYRRASFWGKVWLDLKGIFGL